MRYACLVYGDFGDRLAASSSEWDRTEDAYRAFYRNGGPGGVIVAGATLRPGTTGFTLDARRARGRPVPGPALGAPQHLGGLYLIDCEDLDQALAFAAAIPGAASGAVEVRPVYDLG